MVPTLLGWEGHLEQEAWLESGVLPLPQPVGGGKKLQAAGTNTAWLVGEESSSKLTGELEKSIVRTVITITIAVATALCSSAAFTQQPCKVTGSISDFSGVWGHLSLPGFEPPASSPGPVTNRLRLRGGPQRGVGDPRQLVGDYTNPILKPAAAEVVKEYGENELNGVGSPNPNNQCWPEPVPYIFWNVGMQMLQQPDKSTILYWFDHQVRHVRMNQPHSAHLTPSWHGDSVGHYEGDRLIIDTVGIKAGPFAMVDHYGTPYTPALHVVERYRLLDYEAAKEGLERDAKENFRITPTAPNDSGLTVDPNYKGEHLQLQFTVEDDGVFTMPWSATITYGRPVGELGEHVCAENIQWHPSPNTVHLTIYKP
jgi:hypothetical protein